MNPAKTGGHSNKPKKSLSRIKSNYFHQNVGPEIKPSASNANLRKTSTRKRRNVNSSATLKSKTKNITSTVYYTHRDKEVSKRGVNNSKILTEISENRYPKTDQAHNIAKKHCESTKVSHRNQLKNTNADCVNR
jgi:hypothetical protein